MNKINQMKNMVVIKNLPSNIIEEAIVILKPNKKIKPKKILENNSRINNMEEDYILKEAEMVINNYLTNVEKESKIKSNHIKQLENKYKRLKKVTIVLAVIIFSIIIFKVINI